LPLQVADLHHRVCRVYYVGVQSAFFDKSHPSLAQNQTRVLLRNL
jgi:hypothetical protein